MRGTRVSLVGVLVGLVGLGLLVPGSVSAAPAVNVQVTSVEFLNNSNTFSVLLDPRTTTLTGKVFKVSNWPDGCPSSPAKAQWRDCVPAAFPDGTAEKNWPIVAVRNTRLQIHNAILQVQKGQGPLKNVTITGTATVGQSVSGGPLATFTFTEKNVTQNAKGQLILGGVTASAAVPDEVGAFTGNGSADRAALPPMKIKWTVTDGANTYDAGSNDVPLYVTAHSATSKGKSNMYWSLVDLVTTSAAGDVNRDAIVNDVYRPFQGAQRNPRRPIRRLILCPGPCQVNNVTQPAGSVLIDAGSKFVYYPLNDPGGWTLQKFLLNLYDYGGDCNGTLGILQSGVGRCGGWAEFFSRGLGIHGISAPDVSITSVGGWRPGFPAGAPVSCAIDHRCKMLIKNWNFAVVAGAAPFKYVTKASVDATTGEFTLNPGQVTKATGVAGLGNENPPGWFDYGDHAVVTYTDARGTKLIYDPSYGTGPFDNLCQWATASLDGVATVDPVKIGEDEGPWTITAKKGVADFCP